MFMPPFQLLLFDIFYVLILHSSNSTKIVQKRNRFALHVIFFSMDSRNNGKILLFSRGRTRKEAAVPSIRQDSSIFLRFFDLNVLNVNDSTPFIDKKKKIVEEEKKYWEKKREKINERLFKNVSVFTVY